MNVINLDAYRKRRQSQEGKTIQTSVPCGTCGELLLLATHVEENEPDETILVCLYCSILISLGNESESH